MTVVWMIVWTYLLGLVPMPLRPPVQAAPQSEQSAAPPRSPGFSVVPPGPVTESARVELRLALPGSRPSGGRVRVRFFHDKMDDQHLIASQNVTMRANEFTLVRAWWSPLHQSGRHRLLYRVDGEGAVKPERGAWPMEVLRSNTSAPPAFQGAWIEPMAVLPVCAGKDAKETERNLRDSVDAMHRLGMTTLIITYVEYQGTFSYPSQIAFYDRDMKRMSYGKNCPLDIVGIVLSQADLHGMHVILGLGRSGDTPLLWEFEKPDWQERCTAAISTSEHVAQELWQRYGSHSSFYGWYLTHEMNDLAKASAYYDPVADFCHSLSPDKPVLVAPAGTPIMDRETLRASHVDIFAFQDAVGSGYIPNKNTFHPENRIAMLDTIYSRYRGWLAGTDKHLWADLEVWEMDGSQGYAGSYPASFDRVLRQIEIEKGYVEMLTAYAYHGYLHAPGSRGPAADRRADLLFQKYVAYLSRLPRAPAPEAEKNFKN
jgi:hypothetical protein